MSYSHTLRISHIAPGGTLSQDVTLSADSEARYEVAFASDASDVQAEIQIPDTTVMLTMVSTAALTIEYNDGSGTQGEIVLAANLPLVWWTGAEHSLANVMGYAGGAVDVTDCYLTADGTAGTLTVYVLADSTP